MGVGTSELLKHVPLWLWIVLVVWRLETHKKVGIMRSDTETGDRQQTRAGPHKRVTNYNTFRPDNCELNNNTNQHHKHERFGAIMLVIKKDRN